MTNKHSHKGVFFGVLAALAFGLFAWPALAGSGQQPWQASPPAALQAAQPVDPVFSPPSPRGPDAFGGGSPLVIPAAAFASDGFNPDSLYFSFGGGYFRGNSQNDGCLTAPAYLPQQATVTDMFASVYDNDGSQNITVSLRRVDNFSGTGATLAAASTSGTFNGLQIVNDASIDNPLILFPDYAYYVTACLVSSSLRLYSVRLYYTYADLQVTKLASADPVNAGSTLTYTINAANIGGVNATGVTVSDTLPLNVTYQSASASQGSCLESGGTVTCTLGDIPASSNAVITIVTTVDVLSYGTISNTATASGSFTDGNPDNNQGSVVVTIRPPNFLPIINKSFP